MTSGWSGPMTAMIFMRLPQFLQTPGSSFQVLAMSLAQPRFRLRMNSESSSCLGQEADPGREVRGASRGGGGGGGSGSEARGGEVPEGTTMEGCVGGDPDQEPLVGDSCDLPNDQVDLQGAGGAEAAGQERRDGAGGSRKT